MRYLELGADDMAEAEKEMEKDPVRLDQLRASSIAANAVIGSVFYAFPAGKRVTTLNASFS